MWRALSGAARTDPGLLEQLQCAPARYSTTNVPKPDPNQTLCAFFKAPNVTNRLGWSLDDAAARCVEGAAADCARKGGGLRARHGTSALASYALQRREGQRCGIYAQDTKGQQFFDDAERSFAERAVDATAPIVAHLKRE